MNKKKLPKYEYILSVRIYKDRDEIKKKRDERFLEFILKLHLFYKDAS